MRELDYHLYLKMRPRGHPWFRRWETLRAVEGVGLDPIWASDFMAFARGVDAAVGFPESPYHFLMRRDPSLGLGPDNVQWQHPENVLTGPDADLIRAVPDLTGLVDSEEVLDECVFG